LKDPLFIVTCSDDRTIRVWNIEKSLQEYFLIAHESSINSLNIDKDCSMLVSSSFDCCVRFWTVSIQSKEVTLARLPLFQKFLQPAVTTTCNFELFLVVSGFFDGSLRTWNYRICKSSVFMNAHQDSINHLHINGLMLASCSADCTLGVWRLENLAKLHSITLGCVLTRCVISNDFLYIVSAGYDKTLYIWSNLAKRMLIELSGHSGEVTCVRYFKNDKLLASASGDSSVRLWSTYDKVQEHIFQGHRSRVNSISLDDDESLLASCSFDRSVKIWNLRSRKLFRSFDEHDWGVLSVKFMNSGKYCVSTTESSIYVWRINN
jgi:WD40 repeat protein